MWKPRNWTQSSRHELTNAEHRWRITLSLLVNALPTIAQGAVCPLCHKGMLPAPVQFRGVLTASVQSLVHQDLPGPFLQSCLPAGQSPACNGGSQGQELHFPLLNLMRFLFTHFSTLSRSFLMAAPLLGLSTIPPGIALSADLLRVLCPLSQIISEDISCHGRLRYTTNDWAPTGLYSLSLAVQPVSIHIHFSSLFFIRLSMRMSWEVVSKAMLKSSQPYPQLSSQPPSYTYYFRRWLCWPGIISVLQIHVNYPLPPSFLQNVWNS